MIPYLFSLSLMRAVGKAAEKMVEAVSEDFLELQYNKKIDVVKKPNTK